MAEVAFTVNALGLIAVSAAIEAAGIVELVAAEIMIILVVAMVTDTL